MRVSLRLSDPSRAAGPSCVTHAVKGTKSRASGFICETGGVEWTLKKTKKQTNNTALMELEGALQLTHLKCAIQWFSVSSPSCTTITKIGFYFVFAFPT